MPNASALQRRSICIMSTTSISTPYTILYGSQGHYDDVPHKREPQPVTMPLDDRVETPKNLDEKNKVFTADYMITDFTGAFLFAHTAGNPDMVEIISKRVSTLVPGKIATDNLPGGFRKNNSTTDLKALFDSRVIDNNITIKITGSKGYKTFWNYTIIAKAGTKGQTNEPVRKNGAVKRKK